MMIGDSIYTRIVDMPPGVHEYVAPSFTGYNIYISSSLDEKGRNKAWLHALEHIARDDFNSNEDIGTIESRIS